MDQHLRGASRPRWQRLATLMVALATTWLLWPVVKGADPQSIQDQTAKADVPLASGDPATTACSVSLPITGYWLGPEFSSSSGNLPLSYARTRCQAEDPSNAALAGNHYIGFIYGDCIPEEDVCSPPLEIQTAPRTERDRSLYTFDGAPYPSRDVVVSNASLALQTPSASFDGGRILELYTKDGTSTISIFANTPELAIVAAESLRPAPAQAVPASP